MKGLGSACCCTCRDDCWRRFAPADAACRAGALPLRLTSGAVTLIGGSCDADCAGCAAPDGSNWVCAVAATPPSSRRHDAITIAVLAERNCDFRVAALPIEQTTPYACIGNPFERSRSGPFGGWLPMPSWQRWLAEKSARKSRYLVRMSLPDAVNFSR